MPKERLRGGAEVKYIINPDPAILTEEEQKALIDLLGTVVLDTSPLRYKFLRTVSAGTLQNPVRKKDLLHIFQYDGVNEDKAGIRLAVCRNYTNRVVLGQTPVFIDNYYPPGRYDAAYFPNFRDPALRRRALFKEVKPSTVGSGRLEPIKPTLQPVTLQKSDCPLSELLRIRTPYRSLEEMRRALDRLLE